jgi:malonyl-CoA/methylmalonyl-CoA synthetase
MSPDSALPPLLPALANPTGREAVRFGDRALSYAQLQAAATDLARHLDQDEGTAATEGRVAIWAEPTLETCIAVVAALAAGVAAVPINPRSGERELAHIVSDSAPSLVLARPEASLPAQLSTLPRIDVAPTTAYAPAADAGTATTSPPASTTASPPASTTAAPPASATAAPTAASAPEPPPDTPALIVYTSGTTGAPKGVILPRRAIASTLDALAEAWAWTDRDVLVHGLPLFHVHGLVLGVLGPLRLGGALHHVGTFSVEAVTAELSGGATMLFGVPTMYHRLAAAAEENSNVAEALGRARLLVSGSAALSTADHERIERATGQRMLERYGMTETLMICSVRAEGDRRPGTVGLALAGVELKLVDEEGQEIEAGIGEIRVRGPNLFLGYVNRPDATAAAFADGWFRTGDVATREPDGYIRLIGRQATDLIKSGGFKIGAGEIEAALLEHTGVAEAAVTGEPDPDLGERIVAWVVPAAAPPPSERELAEHVARLLTPHKRPRTVRYVDSLPRNDMGKVLKKALKASTADADATTVTDAAPDNAAFTDADAPTDADAAPDNAAPTDTDAPAAGNVS